MSGLRISVLIPLISLVVGLLLLFGGRRSQEGDPGTPPRKTEDRNLSVSTPIRYAIGAEAASTIARRSAPSRRDLALGRNAAERFRGWLEAQPDPISPSILSEGSSLLEHRRAAMKWLIRHDPEEALVQALSFAERERLPEAWLPLLEERFSTVAELVLLPDCSPGQAGRETNLIVIRAGQPSLRGLAWAQMTEFRSKNNLPVEGIALDSWTALMPNGVKLVSGRERAATERLFPVAPSAEFIAPREAGSAALIAGQIHRFAE